MEPGFRETSASNYTALSTLLHSGIILLYVRYERLIKMKEEFLFGIANSKITILVVITTKNNKITKWFGWMRLCNT